MSAVAAEPQRPGAVLQLLRQSCQGQGLILGQAGQRPFPAREQRRIDLAAAGVHHRDNGPLKAQQPPGDGLRGGNTDAGGVGGEGQPLDGGDADAQPGKGAGPPADSIIIDPGRGDPGAFKQALGHRQQRDAVGLGNIQEFFAQQAVVPVQGGRGRRGGAFQGKQQHISHLPSLRIGVRRPRGPEPPGGPPR